MNGMGRLFAVVAAGFFVIAPCRADLEAVKAERDLEKRSEKALDHASHLVTSMREAYKAGRMDEVVSSLREIADSVELAGDSLRETGKNPRKSSKYFKRAEKKTRDLLRRLDSFEQELSVSEREPATNTIARAQKVLDTLVQGILTGKL